MFFTSSQQPWTQPKAVSMLATPMRAPAVPAVSKPECCGWFDSSFDLAAGLDVTEQDCNTLYQLWDLSQR
ncbi:hypothetical protein NYO99_13005 [Pelomonas sp. UHG3]|uniref:Uncharacterized protein n=1 Tax=Roseateles hydrophilus TaxID=2975054 RepID=A0ACC6CBT1_9BURK|nr:hypothetical protein [Pelomonas sp. UHG3]MCY4745896.1 hypothetical protein [Pelomonas sp. UHG3]